MDLSEIASQSANRYAMPLLRVQFEEKYGLDQDLK